MRIRLTVIIIVIFLSGCVAPDGATYYIGTKPPKAMFYEAWLLGCIQASVQINAANDIRVETMAMVQRCIDNANSAHENRMYEIYLRE